MVGQGEGKANISLRLRKTGRGYLQVPSSVLKPPIEEQGCHTEKEKEELGNVCGKIWKNILVFWSVILA